MNQRKRHSLSKPSALIKQLDRHWSSRRVRRFILTWVTTLIFTLSFGGLHLWFPHPAFAAPNLTILPLTWDFIGLDSNNPSDGPNSFLIGARVCNTGSSDAENLVIKFVREGATNPYITVTATGDLNRTDTIIVDRLSAGGSSAGVTNHHQSSNKPANCFDAYYNAEVQRTSAAYGTVQKYHIEASADGAGLVETPANRQLYVERLISQGRNDVISFTNLTTPGSNTVLVGETYQFRLVTTTASAYSQLTVSSNFPNAVFQFEDISTTYTNPGASNSSIYADACGYIVDYTDPGYNRSSSNCDGPVPDQYPGGKVGETITTDYTVKILSTGTNGTSSNLSVDHLILDFSGGSYHYNADNQTEPFTITIFDPQADLSLTKSHTGNFSTGTNTYNLTVTNNGGDTAKAPITLTDTLPTGYRYNSVDAASASAGWSCASAGQTVTCNNSNDLTSGNSSTLNLNVDVDNTAATNSLNIATVSSPTTDPNLSNNTATDPTTVLQGANLRITKSHTADPFLVGNTETYTLLVENTSSTDTASGPITVNDTLPTGLTFISGTGTDWACNAVGQDVTCTNPNDFAPGTSSTITLSVFINANVALNSVTNTANVSGTSLDVNPADNSDDDVTNTAVPSPDLSITKTHIGTFARDPAPNRSPDITADYTLTITNVGQGNTTGAITITDTLPSALGMSFRSFSGTGWTCTNATNGTCTAGDTGILTFTSNDILLPGQTRSITLTVMATINGTADNVATVSTTGDTNNTNDEARDSTTVAEGNVDLRVIKTVTTTPTNPGDAIAYNIELSNQTNGNGSDTGISFVDEVPAGITGVTWDCTYDFSTDSSETPATHGSGNPAAINSCDTNNPNSLASGSGNTINLTSISLRKRGGSNYGKLQINVTGTVSGDFMGTLTNTATITPSLGVDEAPSDNVSTVSTTVNGTDLRVTKTAEDTPFATGKEGLYTITVTNDGSLATTNPITVTDTLPSSFNFVSAVSAPGSTGWNCSNSGQTVTCINSTPLAVDETSSILLTVIPTTAGSSFINTVSIEMDGDRDPANNTGTADTPVVAPDSDLIITKAGPATVNLGDSLTYTLTVRNEGTTSAVASSTNPIIVTDTLQEGLTFISGTGTGWFCSASGQVVTCRRSSSLAAGSQSDITLNALVTATATSPLLNEASVALNNETVTGNNDSNQVSTTMNGSADLAITKTANGSFVDQQDASYALVVTNNGPSGIGTSDPITVSDTLPSNLSFVATGSGSANFSCSAAGQVVTCTSNAGLAAGSSETIALNVSVTADTPNPIVNTASVSSPVSDPNTANNSDDDSVAVTPNTADLELQKSHTGNFVIGQTGTYTLTVRNYGGAIAKAPITITDPLPDDLTYASALGSNWSCSADASDVVTCTYSADLAVNESSSVDLTVNVGASTPVGTNSITNQASVTSATPEPTSETYSNIASDPTTVVQGTDLSIAKSDSGTFRVNATDTAYVLTIKNESSVSAAADASNPITVIDYLPLGIRFDSVDEGISGFSCTSDAVASGNTVTCRRTTDMPAGYTDTITLDVSVLVDADFPLENIATIGGLLTPESDFTNNTASNTVSSSSDLLLVKRLTAINRGQAGESTFDSTFENHSSTPDDHPYWPPNYLAGTLNQTNVKPGDELEYTIYFLSGGSKALTNADICDVIPENTTYVANSMRLRFGSDASETVLTDDANGDAGELFNNGTGVPCGSVQGATRNVAVFSVVDHPETLPPVTGVGIPANSYGYVRFRTTID